MVAATGEHARALAVLTLGAALAGCSVLFPFAPAGAGTDAGPNAEAGLPDADRPDAGDPSCSLSLAPAGSVEMPGSAIGVAVSDTLAVVAAGARGIYVFDVVDPGAPMLTATLATAGPADDVALSDDIAIVTQGEGGIAVVNLEDPGAPGVVATLDLDGYAEDITIDGALAYVAVGIAGLAVVDLSDPDDPRLRDSWDEEPFRARGVAVRGDYAFLAAHADGLEVLDLSGARAQELFPPVAIEGGIAVEVATLTDSVVLVADAEGGLAVIDLIPRAVTGVYDPSCWVLDVVPLAEDRALVACGEDGIFTADVDLDVSDLPVAHDLLVLHEGGRASAVAVRAEWAFVADGAGGLQIASFSEPGALTWQSEAATPGVALDVAAAGTLAVVARGQDGVALVDAYETAAPEVVGVYDTDGTALAVELVGSVAYVADGERGLTILDVSDPDSPERFGQMDTPGWASDLAVADETVVVADGTEGLQVFHVDPVTWKIAGAGAGIDFDDDATSVALSGDIAYVAFGEHLQVVDLNDPSDPVPGQEIDLHESILGVAAFGTWVLAAVGSAGLMVVDTTSVVSTQIPLTGTVRGVTVSGGKAWVAAEGAGVLVVDLSDPQTPVREDGLFIDGTAVSVVGADGLAFVADRDGFLRVIEARCSP